MHGYRFIAIAFAGLAAALDGLSMWMMHLSGVTQGATESGQWALGNASMAVHLGLAVCGLAMFISRNLLVSLICGVLMLGAAACSAWQIAGFLAAEVISVDMARQQAELRETARNAALIEMAKERQKTQAELAKSTLKWMHGTERRADGRRERKDSFEAATKLVTDMGKAEAVPLPEVKVETTPRLQSNPLGPWLAAKFGYDKMTMQAAPLLMISLAMLVMSVVFWPLASWFWSRSRPTATEIGPAPAAPAMRVPALAPQPAALESVPSPPKALPAPIALETAEPEPPPKPPHPSKVPVPAHRPRHPVSEAARDALDAAGYPRVKPTGPVLEQCLPADRFALWMRAFGLHGSHEWRKLYALYQEAATEFHCETLTYNTLAALLDNRRLGVTKRRPAGSETTWDVAPFRPKRAALGEPETPSKEAERIADAAPAEEGRGRRPFSSGAARTVGTTVLMRPSQGEPAWLHEQGKVLRRWRLEQSRKQRGVRAGRRAA